MYRVTEGAGDAALQEHVSATYFTLRWGVAILAILFPLVLWLGGLVADVSLQNSMSAYYHAAPAGAEAPMRDWFVGFLFALGALMYLYKGFTTRENVLLNVASVLAVGVAIFPMAWPEGSGGGIFSIHGACAIGAFICLALVAWLSPKSSLDLMTDEGRRAKYAATYRAFAVFMAVFPVIAWLLTIFLGEPGKFKFVAEALGLAGFAGFWVTKSLEMSETDGDLKAAQGLIAVE